MLVKEMRVEHPSIVGLGHSGWARRVGVREGVAPRRRDIRGGFSFESFTINFSAP